jgi:osmotically-inducible protein OsmY
MTTAAGGYPIGVTNEPEAPEYVIERVHQALAGDPAIHELGVQVAVAGARVFLTGHVGTVERRQAITAVAQRVLPDHTIHNQTTVGAFPEAEGMEEVGR